MKTLIPDRKLLLLIALILLSIPFNAAGEQLSTAPLNPAFVQYQQERTLEETTPTTMGLTLMETPSHETFALTADPAQNFLTPELTPQNLLTFNEPERQTGLLPSPVDLSHICEQPSGMQINKPAGYPSRFELRDHNGDTGVKDQGYAGTCWIFSAMGSLESYMLYSQSEEWDFSENHPKNLLVASNPDGFNRSFDGGGFNLESAAYLTSWRGPVPESDDPYDDMSDISPEDTTVAKHVQEILIAPGINSSEDLFKWMLTNYGAISVSYYMDYSYYDSTNSSFYYYDEYSHTNHAVTLVGWDDNYDAHNFTRTAPGNGAFIIRNSWGEEWGEDGYFYISYYDTSFGNDDGLYVGETKPSTHNYLYTAENVSNYDRIYQYDPLGWTACEGYNNSSAYAANVFTATANETLEAVSFYAVDQNTLYNISIYLDPDNGPMNSSGPVERKNGTRSMAGYYTIDLENNVSLTAGQNFSVVIKLTTPDYNYPLAVEVPVYTYSDNAHAEPGQSYVSNNGTLWTDLADDQTNNCIKAFTKEGRRPQAALVADMRLLHKNGTVSFHDSSLFSPDTWYWDFGDNANSSLQNPSHEYSVPGKYTVTLNVSNSYGNNITTRTAFIHVVNSTIVVNQSGSADFTNISDALDAAQDGYTILIDPGNYNESLEIDKDNITLISSTADPDDVTITDTFAALINEGENVTITGLTFSNSIFGLVLFEDNCSISNCTFTDNIYAMTFFYSQNSRISNCIMTDNVCGLHMEYARNNIFRNNTARNNTANYWFNELPNDVTPDNTADGRPVYHLVSESDRTLNATSNASLVHLINCSNITLQDLDLANNYLGMFFHNSSNVNVTNCTAVENIGAIYLSYTDNSTIINCNFSYNLNGGIILDDSCDNLIYNNLFNNSDNIYVSGNNAGNRWNITKTAGTNIRGDSYLAGNCWCTPDGTGFSQINNTDLDLDGICDDQYDLGDNQTDYLPLATPDVIGPEVNINRPLNTTLTSNTVIINATANEYVAHWWYSISNTTSCINTSAFTGNTSLILPDGPYTLNVTAQDVAGNNGSTTVNFTIDTTGPGQVTNLTHTTDTTWISWAWTNPADLNHSIIYLDGSFVTNTSEAYFRAGGLNPATRHTISIMTVDEYGNWDWTNNSVWTDFLPDSGSPASVGQSRPAQEVISTDSGVKKVLAGANVEYDLSQGEGPVLGISFEARSNEGNVVANVQVLRENPVEPAGCCYQMMSITVGREGTISSDNAENIQISFRVSREWIAKNNIDIKTLRLSRYSDGAWTDLPTEVTGEDDGYIYLSATTPGFSLFQVTGDQIRETTAAVEDTSTPEEEVEPSAKETAPTPAEENDTPGFTAGMGIIILAAVAICRRK